MSEKPDVSPEIGAAAEEMYQSAAIDMGGGCRVRIEEVASLHHLAVKSFVTLAIEEGGGLP